MGDCERRLSANIGLGRITVIGCSNIALDVCAEHKGVVMARYIRGLGALFLCLVFNIHNSAFAAEPSGDIARQLKDVQKQLREMRDEMGKLSGRLEKIEALIPPPRKPQKVTVNLHGAPLFGNPKATIGIVEFSDYQCPYCRRFHLETFPQLQKSYIDPGKVAFAVKNFPLDFHPLAMDAALTVNCARQQNIKAFWDIQGEMFLHQNRLGKALYDQLVKRYGLDHNKFSNCLAEAKQRDSIAEDLNYARRLGVQGTPTFFIGRLEGDQLVDAVRLVGAQPYREFARILDSFNHADSYKKM